MLKNSLIFLLGHLNCRRRLTASLLALGLLALSAALSFAPTQAASPAQVRVLESNTNRIVLELELTDYNIREQRTGGTLYSIISVPELGPLREDGKPQLPIKGAFIGIPPGAQAKLNILIDDNRRDNLAYPPLPAPTAQVQYDPKQIFPRDLGNAYLPDRSIYSGNQVFPVQVAKIASTGDWRSQHFAVVEFHPFQYDPPKRQLIFHRRVRVELAFSYPGGQTRQALGSPLNEGAFESVLQQSVLNYDTAKNWRARTTVPTRAPQGTRAYTTGTWYKIPVNADGIYQVTCAQLQTAGLVPSSLDATASKLQLYDQGNELAINVAGNSWNTTCGNVNYFEFFGQKAQSNYSFTNVYWLTISSTNGKRMATRSGLGSGAVSTTFVDTWHLEQDKNYISNFPFVEDADHWFWTSIAGGGAAFSDTFQTPNRANGVLTATLIANLVGYSTGYHHTQFSINGNILPDSIVWNGTVAQQVSLDFPQSYLNAGATPFSVTELSDYGSSTIYINSFDIRFASDFTAASDMLRFRNTVTNTTRYQIGGFTNSDILAFDITDPFTVTLISPTTIPQPCSPCTVEFAESLTTSREYFVLASTPPKSTGTITRYSPYAANLHNSSYGADYVIISYGAFIPNLTGLINQRTAQGMRVKVIDVQDVYDEFSDGSMTPQAIRDFLAYAFSNWQAPAPSYVLLVGDGHFDPKSKCLTPGTCFNITTPANSTFIPPYLRLVDPWIGETASDNRLVAFYDGVGNLLPQMAIGRLPAQTTAHVNAMVAKILSNEQNPPAGNWRNTVTFVSDKAYSDLGALDSAGNFWALSDEVASNPRYLPSFITADRIYYNPCASGTYPQCALPYPQYSTPTAVTDALVAAINNGRLIVNYVGHAAHKLWGDQFFSIYDPYDLTRNDLGRLNNTKYPVMLPMTCYDGYFHYPGYESIGEENVRLANYGALASWSPAGKGVATGHDYLDRGFFDAVFRQRTRQIGAAAVSGKIFLWTNSGGADHDLIDTYNLLGDPASRLNLPAINDVFLPFVIR